MGGRIDTTLMRLRSVDLRTPGLGYLLSRAGGTTGSLPRDIAIKSTRAYERDRWRYSPRRLGSRVDRIPLDRPIFLLGTQGAGETIIGRCLRRNHLVVSVSGNSDSWTGADEMATIRNRMRALPSSLWGSKHRSDLVHPLIGTDQLYACDALLPAYRRTADDADPSDADRFKRVLREHLAVYGRDPDRSRFLDKTHAYTVKIPLLAALLEGANPFFVVVVRNPYETCRWAIERKPTLFRAGVARRRRLELLAEHWSNAYATALGDASTVPNIATVRFEDFMADPHTVIRALCDFVGLDFDASMVPAPGQSRPFATLPADRKWYPLYRSDWLDGMTAEDEAIVASQCDGLAQRFGYSSNGAARPSSPIEVLGTTQETRADDVRLADSTRR